MTTSSIEPAHLIYRLRDLREAHPRLAVIERHAPGFVQELASVQRDARAFEWSPDSRSIVFLTLDETHVPRFPHVDLAAMHPTVEEQRYPKAGDPNPTWALSVVSLTARPDGTRPRASFARSGDGAEYLPRFGWLPDGKAAWFELLDRDQTLLDLATRPGECLLQ